MPTSSDFDRVPVVIALAGRRVDAPGATPSRFPPENVDSVRDRILRLFEARKATALVCSGACGADLLALEAAERLQMRRRVVLPFSRDIFRRTSVVDRPGEWGTSYDRALDKVEDQNDLVVLGRAEQDSDAYVATNYAILDEAVSLGRKLDLRVVAVVVWDRQSRGPDDITEQFLNEAARRDIEVLPVPTL
jgi:hypothetical protein